MAYTQTDIINEALIMIGSDTVLSPDEEEKGAAVGLSLYESTLKEILALDDWSCLTAYESLAQLQEDGTDELYYVHSVPADFVKKISFYPAVQHRIMGRKVYSNSESLSLTYVRYSDDPNDLDEQLRSILVKLLAAKMAYAVTQDQDVAKNMNQAYLIALSQAQMIDAEKRQDANMADGEDQVSERWVNQERD